MDSPGSHFAHLAGVYAAALTPLKDNGKLDLDSLPGLLEFLWKRGCHGALLFGTTGEGPSFGPGERRALWKEAIRAREHMPGFRLLAGTGTPALAETIDLTRTAFRLGFDGVVTLPPYYFRKASDDGLFAWFATVISRTVPEGGAFFCYHFPGTSGVGISIDVLDRLRDAFPTRFAGLKDSSGSPEFASQLSERFGKDLVVLTGNDRLFTAALQKNASGCITALATLVSPDLRRVWEAHQKGATDPQAQSRLDAARDVLDRYPPASSLLKALLHRRTEFPQWSVRLPLLPLAPEILEQADKEFGLLPE